MYIKFYDMKTRKDITVNILSMEVGCNEHLEHVLIINNRLMVTSMGSGTENVVKKFYEYICKNIEDGKSIIDINIFCDLLYIRFEN